MGVPGTFVVGTIELEAGTIAPPEPDPSTLGLSMALETTADNLYFQVSARVTSYKVIPNRLINLTRKSGLRATHTVLL